MNYAQALAHLHALGPELATAPGGIRRKFELAHMRTLCAHLGDPQSQFPSVLIAGTNGKGSTAATLASILTSAGYRTALYTSPHLIRVNERIQFAHRGTLETISDEDFAALYTRVDQACVHLVAAGQLPFLPSFFERLTAIAFLYFAASNQGEARAEIAVLEVGLGGRLDATNVVEPRISVITDIALDHQEYLGDTITLIAREKCGILRPDGTLVTLAQHPEANQVIGEVATALNVTGINAGDYLPPALRNNQQTQASLSGNEYTLRLEDATEPGLLSVKSPLAGAHQQRNLALAIATAIELRNKHGYTITNEAIERGIVKTNWPGRLEWLAPNLLVDVAHNPAGAWTLRAAISALPETQPRTLIFSCLRDKNLTEMSRILFPLFDSSADGDPLRRHDRILLAPIANPRAAPIAELVSAAHALGVPAQAAPDLAGALALARAITPPGGIVIATGSVYLVGEIGRLVLAPEAVPA
jgi:dihydrofolate synthase/folylpolyglutamate synthase